jgi:acyl carrier protein
VTAPIDIVQRAYDEVSPSPRALRRDDRIEEDLELDSLASMELLVTIEAAAHVRMLEDPRTATARTVGDVCDVIAEPARRDG